MQDERKRRILEQLRNVGEVSVTSLAEEFNVAPMTIRRDLSELGNSGLLQRVHGGAISRPAPSIRSGTLAVEKQRIGKEVSAIIAEDRSVLIDSGSTCLAVASELSKRDDIFAITNSLHAALEFQYSESQLVVLGGLLTSDASLVNGTLFDGRVDPHIDNLVLGCGGVTVEGVSFFDLAETELRHRLLQQSDQVILVADHTKFGKRRAFLLGTLDVIDILVTDKEPDAIFTEALSNANVKTVVAN